MYERARYRSIEFSIIEKNISDNETIIKKTDAYKTIKLAISKD
jgi:hypothetical protein